MPRTELQWDDDEIHFLSARTAYVVGEGDHRDGIRRWRRRRRHGSTKAQCDSPLHVRGTTLYSTCKVIFEWVAGRGRDEGWAD